MIKDAYLGFFGDDYVTATWTDTVNGATHMAIFRDLTDDGITNFVITQLAGPWRTIENGKVSFNETHKDLWWNIRTRAEIICNDLNREADIEWHGDVLQS